MEPGYLRTFLNYPFYKYLCFLTVAGFSTEHKDESLLRLYGFKVPDPSFYPKFQDMMERSNEYVRDFFKKKPKEGSLGFTLCLSALGIEELYNVHKMSISDWEQSWAGKFTNFMIYNKEGSAIMNLFKGRGKSDEIIASTMHVYYAGIPFTLSEIKLYFKYFFDVSKMMSHDWNGFIECQKSDVHKTWYNIIHEQREDCIPWTFGKDGTLMFDEMMRVGNYYIVRAMTKQFRETGVLPKNYDKLLSFSQTASQGAQYEVLITHTPGPANPPVLEVNPNLSLDYDGGKKL